MSIAEQSVTQIPAGTWKADPVHSSIGFAVTHNTVMTFRGELAEFEATLEDGVLQGVAQVASVDVADENLAAHLQSPEFFDAERNPELRFVSRSIVRDGDVVTIEGDLTIKGATRPVTLTGTIAGPVQDAFGGTRLGLDLTTTVNRHDFGVSWNADLPGGGRILEDEVTLTANLSLVQA